MTFDTFSPQCLRDAIEIELQKNDNPKIAAMIALKNLKENYSTLEAERDSLKKENKELKEQLGALRPIRQSMEDYQKTIR